MELSEVKIGDVVSFKNKNGKLSQGKVIHRHNDANNLALSGHVNIQPIAGDRLPVTIHASQLKPAIKEDTRMKSIHEAITELMDMITTGDNLSANNLFNALMQDRIEKLLDETKPVLANAIFSTNECLDCDENISEAKKEEDDEEDDEDEEGGKKLKGKQKNIDVNKNGKLDATDFKMLRAKKGMKEEAEQIEEGNAANKAKKNSYEDSVGKKSMQKGIDAGHGYSEKTLDKPRRLIRIARAAGMKEEAEQTHEAYADPYAAKKAAAMKKSDAENIESAKKEFKAAEGSKGKFGISKIKKTHEEVECIDELSKKTLGSYIRKATSDSLSSAAEGGAHTAGTHYANQQRKKHFSNAEKREKGINTAVSKLTKEEVEPVNEKLIDAAKKVIKSALSANNMSKDKKTSEPARAMIKIAKMNPANTVRKEDVDLQELHADTLRSYISKRYKPNLRDKANGPTYMHNGPGGDPVAQKQIKGIDNAHKSLTKKYASKLNAASDNAAAASYNKSKPGTYHGD